MNMPLAFMFHPATLRESHPLMPFLEKTLPLLTVRKAALPESIWTVSFLAAITSKIQKPKMPTHVGLRAKQDGVERNSVILLEQIRTIDKQRLQARVTALSSTKMAAVDRALAISVGLVSLPKPKTYNKN